MNSLECFAGGDKSCYQQSGLPSKLPVQNDALDSENLMILRIIMMDKVEGKTLCDKSLCADGKVKFAKFKAEVLHHLQRHSFVHGDPWPQIIICSTDSTFFVID